MIANTCCLYLLSRPVPWIWFLQVFGIKGCFMLIELRSGGGLRDHTTWLEFLDLGVNYYKFILTTAAARMGSVVKL